MGPIIRSIDPTAGQVLLRGQITWGDGYAFFVRRPDRTVDTTSLVENAARLEQFISERQADIGLKKKTFLIGVSNGAIMAAALVMRRQLNLDGVILFRPLAPDLAIGDGKKAQPPVLILEAKQDERRKPTDAANLAFKLRQAGFNVSHEATDCGHGPVESESQHASRWLKQCCS